MQNEQRAFQTPNKEINYRIDISNRFHCLRHGEDNVELKKM